MIQNRCKQLLESVSNHFSTSRILYACKANTNIEILKLVRASGVVNVDTVSPGEIALALKAGYSPENIL